MIEAININNYRSIESYTLEVEEISGKRCFIFLGKNEAGKSNILKAISTLNEMYSVDYNVDCNKKAKKKKESIQIELSLNATVMDNFKSTFNTLGIPDKLLRQIKFNAVEVGRTISSKSSSFGLWVYIDKLDTTEYIYEISSEKFLPVLSVGLTTEIATESYLKSNYSGVYKFVTKMLIESVFEKKYLADIVGMIPDCIFWENSNTYLINDPIDLSVFKDDYAVSVTLHNIFKISGIENISERISLIADDYEERAQLKQELSDGITSHINNIWPEHAVNVRIEIEGSICTVMVEDKDDTLPKYKMEQRSDGFKQFVSILLNLSTKSEQSKIIIMDEPEVHLHPSGIKYLRDELLRIAEKNIVVISTHSTYMVDKLNINRHFSVYKDKSCTYIKKLNKDNPYEEEVIYEALGTSIFEHVQPNMILFEGKTDKDVFDVFTSKFRVDFKPLNIGTISTDGVEKIPQYLKFIDNKFVKGFVVVDSDNDGKKIKNQLLKDFSSGRVLEVNDMIFVKEGATLEDLFPIDIIASELNTTYGEFISFSNDPFIKQINERNKILNGKINVKELKGSLANTIIKDIQTLTKIKVKEKYVLLYDFVLAVHNKIKSAND